VKQLHETSKQKKVVDSFMSEARLMNQLRDQNVVALYAVVEEPMSMVMEYCANGALSDLLKCSKSELPWAVRWKIAFECALGIHFMHSRTNKGAPAPVLHRDIKSMNYLIADDVHLRVADFGLSIKQEQNKKSIRNSADTKSNEDEVGSVPWMAPELFKLSPLYSIKSDIYAYGIVLWEIAARDDPYVDCPSAMLIRECVKDGDRMTIPEDTPKEYDKLIQDCWAQVPDQRPTAAQVLERIKKAAGDDLDSEWTRETFMKALKSMQQDKNSSKGDPQKFINSIESSGSSLNSVANSVNSVMNSALNSAIVASP